MANGLEFVYCGGQPYCKIELPIKCPDLPTNYSGNILSPGFPFKIKDERLFGIVFLAPNYFINIR